MPARYQPARKRRHDDRGGGRGGRRGADDEAPQRHRVRSMIAIVGESGSDGNSNDGDGDSATGKQSAAGDSPTTGQRGGAERDGGSPSGSPGGGRGDDNDSGSGIVTSTASPKSPASSSAAATRRSPKDDVARTRNRRMFGGLMGHLARSATELKSATWQQRLARKSEKEEAALKKQREESRKLRERHAEQMQQERVDAAAAAVRAEKEETAALVQGLVSNWIEHRQRLAGFLSTAAEPRLLWRPATHNDTTREMLASRATEVAAECDARRQQAESEIAAIRSEAGLPTAAASAAAADGNHGRRPQQGEGAGDLRALLSRHTAARGAFDGIGDGNDDDGCRGGGGSGGVGAKGGSETGDDACAKDGTGSPGQSSDDGGEQRGH